MNLKQKIKLVRILWKEATELEKAGIFRDPAEYPAVAEELKRIRQAIKGDGKAEVLPDMTETEVEEYLDDVKGWGAFKQKIKDVLDKL